MWPRGGCIGLNSQRNEFSLVMVPTIQMQRRQAAPRLTLLALLAVCLMKPTSLFAQNQEHPVFDAKGSEDNRDHFGQLSFETIDTMTGALVLTHTDLVLPGNAGRELRFQRTYNSKGARGWSFGIAGMVMEVQDPGWPNNKTIPPTPNRTGNLRGQLV